jgi:hypothetical protein
MSQEHNEKLKSHTVTVLLILNGEAETLAHTEVENFDRYRELVRTAVEDAADTEPDPNRPRKRGCRGNPIEVVDVDYSVLSSYKKDGAPHPDEFLRRRVFDNAVSLSHFLGLSAAACHMALRTARSRGKRHATVRGVTFGLVKDIAE